MKAYSDHTSVFLEWEVCSATPRSCCWQLNNLLLEYEGLRDKIVTEIKTSENINAASEAMVRGTQNVC